MCQNKFNSPLIMNIQRLFNNIIAFIKQNYLENLISAFPPWYTLPHWLQNLSLFMLCFTNELTD